MSSALENSQQKNISYYTVRIQDLPFHCPPKDTDNWSMHPKVFLKFDAKGTSSCPYCGSSYKMI